MRICTKSGQPKPIDGFYKDCIKKDGLKSYCKECANGMNKDYYTAKRKEAARKRQAEVAKDGKMDCKRGKSVAKPANATAKPVANATAKPANATTGKSLPAVARQRKEELVKATLLFSKIVNTAYDAVAEAFGLEEAEVQVIVKPKTNKSKK